MQMRSLILSGVLVLLVAGCGGGGGGGTAPDVTLPLTIDWSKNNTAGRPAGESVRIQLFATGSSTPSYDKVVNRETTGVQNYDLTDAPTGDFRLMASLYSEANANGSVTGTVRRIVTLDSGSTLRVDVGEPVNSVQVTPNPKTLKVGQQGTFCATALDADSVATFTPTGDFTWSVTGGVGTVNNDGLVTATTVGTGSVRAFHTGSGKTGSASLTVSPTDATKGKWTVMVFMNAANDLSAFDELNINQMESVAGNPDVRFIVQWKQVKGSWDANPSFQGTRRYLIKPDTNKSSINSQLLEDRGMGIDMGRPQTLSEFIAWTKARYPADRYCLVVWNHGNGWRRKADGDVVTRGVSYDDETGHRIETYELAGAIAGTKWDVFSWDASLMQMMEVAYEIKDQTDYVVGSEESPPGEGLPYDRIFGVFRDNPDSPTRDLTKAFVDGMLAVPEYATRKITQSSVDTSKLNNLRDALSDLGDALRANAGTLSGVIQSVRSTTQGYSNNGTRYYYDIIDLCDKLDAGTNITSIRNATAAVRAAHNAAVVWEGHNAQSPRSHGLSIDFSPKSVINSGSAADVYPKLKFAQDSTWDDWLKNAP